jgi:hypothetical protein
MELRVSKRKSWRRNAGERETARPFENAKCEARKSASLVPISIVAARGNSRATFDVRINPDFVVFSMAALLRLVS